jgi:aldose sugar dehydrogenase
MSAQAGMHLVRLVLDGNQVVAEEKLLAEPRRRIREVRQGPDGALYVIAGDSLLRISRSSRPAGPTGPVRQERSG